MRIATWNVNSLGVRLPQVLDWLAANPVDVLALQELKLTDDKFPIAALQKAGWQAQWFEMIYKAGRMIHHAGRYVLGLGANDPGFDVFEHHYGRMRCT